MTRSLLSHAWPARAGLPVERSRTAADAATRLRRADHQRPHRRRHRRAVVSRRRRHHRRSHHGDRQARRSRQRRHASTPSNLVVAPGFIDMLGQSEFNVLVDPRAASKITQGITTEITGEGASIAPLNDALVKSAQPQFDRFKVALDFRTLGEYFARLESARRPALNVGTFVGAGGVRAYVIGTDQRAATPAEIDADEEAGGAGDGAGRARRQHLAAVRARTDSRPPTRSSSSRRSRSSTAASTFRISVRSRARSSRRSTRCSRSPSAPTFPPRCGTSRPPTRRTGAACRRCCKHFEAARARGLDVTANMYPYDRASNGLDACLPLWVREGGLEQMLQRLNDPAMRDRIKRDMDDPHATDWENQWYGSGGGAGVMVSTVARSGAPEMGREEPRRRSARRWARIRATRPWIS